MIQIFLDKHSLFIQTTMVEFVHLYLCVAFLLSSSLVICCVVFASLPCKQTGDRARVDIPGKMSVEITCPSAQV